MGTGRRRLEIPANARGVAWHVLMRVERDRAFSDLALHTTLAALQLPRRERALATELCYGSLRLRGRLDSALAQVLDRPLEQVDLPVRNLLRLGAYQVLFLERVPPEVAVSESVELAKQIGAGSAAGFVNAVLRQLSRRREGLVFPDRDEDPLGYLVKWGSLPEWLAERWLDQLGSVEAAAMAEASTRPPPRSVRVLASADLDKLARQLKGRACRFAPRGLTRLGVDPVRQGGFRRGEFIVQDEAAQLVPLLLGAMPGDSVVDCCAAPGAKSVQLAEIVGPGGEVIALDSNRSRLRLIHANAERLGVRNLRILARDVTEGFDLSGKQRFPGILVDAPCSGLGVLRRNPDARWRVSRDDIPRSAERQLRILASASRYVGDGGALVYSVCTVTPEETTGVIFRFLAEHKDFRIDDPRPVLPEPAAELIDDSGALVTWPHRHDCDAFWAVRLVRQ